MKYESRSTFRIWSGVVRNLRRISGIQILKKYDARQYELCHVRVLVDHIPDSNQTRSRTLEVEINYYAHY